MSHVVRLGNTVIETIPTIIQDWFENNGSVFTSDKYKAYRNACETRDRRLIDHCTKNCAGKKFVEPCSCEFEIPKINKSDYFPAQPTPRLLSQVLASLDEAGQIDGVIDSLLARLKHMDVKQGRSLLQLLAEMLEADKKHENRLRKDSDVFPG